jgi:lipopolysaccharide/colanic/teichoic acid biosynthesis glycosyltransferase
VRATTQRSQATLYQLIKAGIDVLLAVVLILVFGWLLLGIAVLILLTDGWPVLYTQQRVGQGGKPFTIFKFRTMKVGAPVLSTEEMQRLGIDLNTPLGRLLRKTSLDELPQLFNILKGEMSFIGPRPALLTQHDVNTRRQALGVHALKPGLTGLAQAMGRDDLDTEAKVGYDAEYCRTQSLPTDLRIIALTVKAVLTSRGNK